MQGDTPQYEIKEIEQRVNYLKTIDGKNFREIGKLMNRSQMTIRNTYLRYLKKYNYWIERNENPIKKTDHISRLNISERAKNCLLNGNLNTIDQILNIENLWLKLRFLRNFGKGTFRSLIEELEILGFRNKKEELFKAGINRKIAFIECPECGHNFKKVKAKTKLILIKNHKKIA